MKRNNTIKRHYHTAAAWASILVAAACYIVHANKIEKYFVNISDNHTKLARSY